jgi:hypothetical protein
MEHHTQLKLITTQTHRPIASCAGMASRNTGALVFLLALLLSCVTMSSAARNLQEVEATPPKEEEPSSAGSMPAFPHT